MPIVHPTAPSGVFTTISPHIQSILARPSQPAMQALCSVPANDLTISDGHRCYFVGLDDVKQGRLLTAAKPDSWRFLILAAGKPVADAEIIDHGPAGIQFSSVNYGPMAASAVAALQLAEALATVQTTNYELRCLRIPALYFVALWLHSPNDDIIVPTEPTPTALVAHQQYSEQKIIKLLMRAAQEKQKIYDADKTGELGG